MNALFAPDLFRGKTFLISGAGGGVGSATARLLAGLGARLALKLVLATYPHHLNQHQDALASDAHDSNQFHHGV